MPRPCKCDFCKLMNRVDSIIQKGDHLEMVALVNELLDMYLQESEELSYENAIADGSWPSAVEVLERRLQAARERRLQERIAENMPPRSIHKSPPPPDHVFKPMRDNPGWCELCDATKAGHPKTVPEPEFPRFYKNIDEIERALEFLNNARFGHSAKEALFALGVRNVGDITRISSADILKKAGARTLQDISTYLTKIGLSLKGE